jgi:TatD DNase family protein
MYIDSHTHLYMLVKKKGLTLDDIFSEMKQNGVNSVLNISGERSESEFHLEEAVPFADKHGVKLYHSAGIHPHEASDLTDDTVLWLKEISPFTDAVGEIGLDFHYNFSPPETQLSALRKMMETGIELRKPLIIHGRNAEKEIIQMLEDMGMKEKKVLFHCYTGDSENCLKIMDNGWFISFSGILTFKKISEMTDVIKVCHPDKILFETDSPFLAPHPFRGKINTPAKVKYIYDFAADLLGMEAEHLADKVNSNFKSFLGIDEKH